MTTINIDTIAYGGDVQVRAAIDGQVVRDYAEQMAAGAVFPPIVVFSHDGIYDLADGVHRIGAARPPSMPRSGRARSWTPSGTAWARTGRTVTGSPGVT